VRWPLLFIGDEVMPGWELFTFQRKDARNCNGELLDAEMQRHKGTQSTTV